MADIELKLSHEHFCEILWLVAVAQGEIEKDIQTMADRRRFHVLGEIFKELSIQGGSIESSEAQV